MAAPTTTTTVIAKRSGIEPTRSSASGSYSRSFSGFAIDVTAFGRCRRETRPASRRGVPRFDYPASEQTLNTDKGSGESTTTDPARYADELRSFGARRQAESTCIGSHFDFGSAVEAPVTARSIAATRSALPLQQPGPRLLTVRRPLRYARSSHLCGKHTALQPFQPRN
jgi:hypothetical protein